MLHRPLSLDTLQFSLTIPLLSISIDVDSFSGATIPERAAQAAASISADILSPSGTSYGSLAVDPSMKGYVAFTTKAMVDMAHSLGVKVIPWTINRLNLVESLVYTANVDGIITDYPRDVRVWAIEKGLKVAPQADPARCVSRSSVRRPSSLTRLCQISFASVGKCLKKFNQLTK